MSKTFDVNECTAGRCVLIQHLHPIHISTCVHLGLRRERACVQTFEYSVNQINQVPSETSGVILQQPSQESLQVQLPLGY